MIGWRLMAAKQAAGGGLTLTFDHTAASDVDLTTYTFSGQAIGAAETDRRVVVAVGARNGNALSSATIGGVSAAIDVQAYQTDSRIAVVSAVVPTGTTADVVLTFAGTMSRCGIAVYYITGGATTLEDSTSSTSDPAAAMGLTNTTGALLLGVAASGGSGTGPAYTWSGDVTEDAEFRPEALFTIGAGSGVAPDTSGDVTVTNTGTYTQMIAAAVAYLGA